MDDIEDFEQLDYGDEFDEKYADELDALNDLDDDFESPIKRTKRRLTFESESENLDQPQDPTGKGDCVPSSKRQRTEQELSFEWESEDFQQAQQLIEKCVPSSKRQRTEQDVFPCIAGNEENISLASGSQDTKTNSKHEVGFQSCTQKTSIEKKYSNLFKSCFPTESPSYEKISFTTFDGDIFHLPLRDESYFSNLNISLKKTHVVSQSYAEMRDEAFRLIEIKCKSLQDRVEEEEQKNDDQTLLWVEKFKPKDFLELLSDDGINRALLSWLKLWDKVVFKREVPKRPKKEVVGPHGKPKFQEVIRELDELGRPQQKLALLCGPPGLGKTTLAYIIAKQVGYNVVEMNASDDRSPDVFKRQIESATQMRAVMGHEPRPNCLIIDEVDGATAPAINTLVAFAKNTKKNVLLRPVICICNDLYTPALRPLRQMSLVLSFPPTCSGRLVSRLLEISRFQQLKTDRSALLALCVKAENDIRSCLSTIQFLHSLKGEMRLRDVRSVSVGQKDTQVSMFGVWQQVFQIPRSQKKTNFESRICHDSYADNGRLASILKLILSCGEYEKLLQGIFENYLNINYRDPDLKLTSIGADWMCHVSELQQVIAHLQVYSILPYVPYVVAAFHFLFAVISNVTITYPSAQYEFKTKLGKSENIVTSMFQDMSPVARSTLNMNEVVLTFLPTLLHIIQPSLRPVNTQLFSSREKMELQHVIDTMVTYNLNYRQERNSEGLYLFVLEPNINEVISFTGLKPQNSLSYSAKQLIARELELEKMRKSEMKIEKTVVKKDAKILEQKPVVPNHKQFSKPKTVAVDVAAEAKDFFGRKVTKVIKKESSNMGQGHVWFKFKEGYTNAARKTLYIKDFL